MILVDMYRKRDLKRMVDPALLLMLVIVLVVIGVLWRIPTKDQLYEVRGTLGSYSFAGTQEQQEEADRHGSSDHSRASLFFPPKTILRLQDNQSGRSIEEFPQVWTSAVNDEKQAQELFGTAPVEISVFVDRSRFTNGPVEAYGLQVNGRDIQTVEATLDSDRRQHRNMLMAVGIAILGLLGNRVYKVFAG